MLSSRASRDRWDKKQLGRLSLWPNQKVQVDGPIGLLGTK